MYGLYCYIEIVAKEAPNKSIYRPHCNHLLNVFSRIIPLIEWKHYICWISRSKLKAIVLF